MTISHFLANGRIQTLYTNHGVPWLLKKISDFQALIDLEEFEKEPLFEESDDPQEIVMLPDTMEDVYVDILFIQLTLGRIREWNGEIVGLKWTKRLEELKKEKEEKMKKQVASQQVKKK